jgi:hypothetical protein
VIAPLGPEEHWDYRRAAVGRILDAVRDMIMRKSTAPPRALA